MRSRTKQTTGFFAAVSALLLFATPARASYLTSFGSAIFDFCGGYGGTECVETHEGQSMPDIKFPSRTGYTFNGYFSQPNGVGAQYYTPWGAGPRLCDWGCWNSMKLYANWLPNRYLATFNANGGTGGLARYYSYGEKISAPTPTRTGYSFAGWTPAVASTMVAHDVTYKATWTPKRCRVAFNPNGGKGKMEPQVLAYDKAAKLSANRFSRKGYVFLGWARSRGGAVAYGNRATVKNLSPGGTVTLFAVWAKRNYKVVFVANGGKGKMAKQTLTYGKAAKLRSNTFTRAGYVFLGWAKSAAQASKGTVTFPNAKSVKNLTRTGHAVRLYAVWAKRNYKVAFVANGGMGKMAAQTMTYGKSTKLRANAFTRSGYSFSGWATSMADAADGVVAFTNGQATRNLTRDGRTITLYAVWRLNYKGVSPSIEDSSENGPQPSSTYWIKEYENEMALYRNSIALAEAKEREIASIRSNSLLSETSKASLISSLSYARQSNLNNASEHYRLAQQALAKAQEL